MYVFGFGYTQANPSAPLHDCFRACCKNLVKIITLLLIFIFLYCYVHLFGIVCHSDGKTVGATLDRNGLRPARYWRTEDNVVYVASEVCLIYVEI